MTMPFVKIYENFMKATELHNKEERKSKIGASLFLAAEKVQQSGVATGIDFSKEMVAEMRKEIINKDYFFVA